MLYRQHTYKPVKQEVNGAVILPPLVFPGITIGVLGTKFITKMPSIAISALLYYHLMLCQFMGVTTLSITILSIAMLSTT